MFPTPIPPGVPVIKVHRPVVSCSEKKEETRTVRLRKKFLKLQDVSSLAM